MYDKYDNINKSMRKKPRPGAARQKRVLRRLRRRQSERRGRRWGRRATAGGSTAYFNMLPHLIAKARGSIRVSVRIVIFVIIAAAAWRAFMYADGVIGASLENAAEIKMREYVENIVIHSVHDVLAAEDQEAGEQERGVITPVLNSEGAVSMVTLNTDTVNRIGNEIAMKVNSDIHDGVAQTIKVSLGTMLRSRLLSQITPAARFDIMPVSVSEVGYKTEFEDAGINQTKYKVYIVINTEARVMAPFLAENIHVENTVLAAETVIVGGVPDTYANIPHDNISDFVS